MCLAEYCIILFVKNIFNYWLPYYREVCIDLTTFIEDHNKAGVINVVEDIFSDVLYAHDKYMYLYVVVLT